MRILGMVNWRTLIPGEIYFCDNFLEVSTYDNLMQSLASSDTSVLDGSNRQHAVGNTFYNYNVIKYNVRNDKQLIEEVFTKLNVLMTSLGDAAVDYTKPLGYLQFFAKSFNPQSRYDLHAESAKMFGKYVFVNYLSDESSGELIFPTEQESEDYLTAHPSNRQGWEETKVTLANENNPIRYIGPLTVLPKKNTCIVFTTGTAHIVNNVVSSVNTIVRPSLSGWINSDDSYMQWYKSQLKVNSDAVNNL
jgi:hypothetical protein